VSDPSITRSLARWEFLKDGFPVLFWGVRGEDFREEESASFYNLFECQKVVEIVELLLNSKSVQPPVTLNDIGVVTPFFKQVRMIRNHLRSAKHHNVRVGSVEDYQGQEEKIIIISTVRSSPYYLNYDQQHQVRLKLSIKQGKD